MAPTRPNYLLARPHCLPYHVFVKESVRENFVDELCKAMDEVYPSSYANDGLSGGGRGHGDFKKMLLLLKINGSLPLSIRSAKYLFGNAQ
ncbi:hypothetical protein ACHAW5_009127 [Stephanodiscus triporus]|uniref:Uncharacterized protein n=1 Tax=Stephanodiscus triporus TaxID=2934178 RepID=A0ABD3NHM9_9STRA